MPPPICCGNLIFETQVVFRPGIFNGIEFPEDEVRSAVDRVRALDPKKSMEDRRVLDLTTDHSREEEEGRLKVGYWDSPRWDEEIAAVRAEVVITDENLAESIKREILSRGYTSFGLSPEWEYDEKEIEGRKVAKNLRFAGMALTQRPAGGVVVGLGEEQMNVHMLEAEMHGYDAPHEASPGVHVQMVHDPVATRERKIADIVDRIDRLVIGSHGLLMAQVRDLQMLREVVNSLRTNGGC